MEIWKDINGYEGFYQVSDLGRIKSLHYNKERILKPSHDKRGYLIVDLRKLGTRYTVHIHRLVGQAFIENPLNKSTINHKDEIKINNKMDNLEWMTNTENINHGSRTQNASIKRYKPIIMCDKNGEVLQEFGSIKEATKLGFNNTGISQCCNDRRKSYKGYIWKFAQY